jgi:hypothetical protein
MLYGVIGPHQEWIENIYSAH